MVHKNLLIPLEVVNRLHYPLRSIRDGSPAKLVEVRSWGYSLFRRSVAVTVPLDEQAAAAVSTSSRLRYAETFALRPARYLLIAAALISLANAWAGWRVSAVPFLLAAGAIMVEGVMWLLERRFVLPQHPRRVGRHLLLIRYVPADVADEWAAANPDIKTDTHDGHGP